jgi:hypothetical protein
MTGARIVSEIALPEPVRLGAGHGPRTTSRRLAVRLGLALVRWGADPSVRLHGADPADRDSAEATARRAREHAFEHRVLAGPR